MRYSQDAVFYMFVVLVIPILFFHPFALFSQGSIYNNESTIFLSDQAVLYVSGEIVSTGTTGLIHNDGDLYASQGIIVSGNLRNLNGSVIKGKGNFHISRDWVNDGQFITDNTLNKSIVRLNGNNQVIKGVNATTFYDLVLAPSNTTKSLQVDVNVSNSLDINDNELNIGNNLLRLTNPASGALLSDTNYLSEGFISNDSGFFSRATGTKENYLFPMGSSNGLSRYRPVSIKPNSIVHNVFQVSFHNYNPILDGYDPNEKDSNICHVNAHFYHRIKHSSGATPADITVCFNPAVDSAFIGMANWSVPLSNVWNDMPASGLLASTGNYSKASVLGWSDFTEDKFTLTINKGPAPIINGPSNFCEGMENLLFSASGSIGPYVWDFPAGVVIQDSTASDSIYVQWGPEFTLVTLEGDLSWCPSRLGLYLPLSSSSLATGFQVDTTSQSAFSPILFTDTSAGAVVQREWNFGDGYVSSDSIYSHIYGYSGEYTPYLVATDVNGCSDTVFGKITITEKLISNNVFTPNNDGLNDEFYFPFASKNGKYHLQVFNRWGGLVFESKQSKIKWDGKNYAGEDQQNGTYFFVLKAFGDKKYYENGSITLLR